MKITNILKNAEIDVASNNIVVLRVLKDTDPKLEVTSYLTPYKDVGYPANIILRKYRDLI